MFTIIIKETALGKSIIANITSVGSFVHELIQQGLEIHGLEECGPWRYTVFNWFPKHLRYTDFGQKP